MSLAVPDAAARRHRAHPAGGGCAAALFHLLTWQRRLAAKRKPKHLLGARRFFSKKLLPPPPSTPPPQPSAPSPRELTVAMPKNRPPGVVARLMGLDSMPPAPGKMAGKKSHGRDIDLPVGSPRSSPRATRLLHAAASRIFENGRSTHRALLFPRGIGDELSGCDNVALMGSVNEGNSAGTEQIEVSGVHTLTDKRISGCINQNSEESLMDRSNVALQSEVMDSCFHVEVCSRLEEQSRQSSADSSRLMECGKNVVLAHVERILSSKDGSSVEESGSKLLFNSECRNDAKSKNSMVTDSMQLPSVHHDQCLSINRRVTTQSGKEVSSARRKELSMSAGECRATSRRDELVGTSVDNSWIEHKACRVCKKKDETRLRKHSSMPRQKVSDISFGKRVLTEEKISADRANKNMNTIQKCKNNSCSALDSSVDASSSNAKRCASKGAESTNSKMEKAIIRSRKMLDSSTCSSSSKPVVGIATLKYTESGGMRNSDSSSVNQISSIKESRVVEEASRKDFDQDGFNRLLQEKIRVLSPTWMNKEAAQDALSGRLTASVLQELISDLVNDKPLVLDDSRCSNVSTPKFSLPDISADQLGSPAACVSTPNFHNYCQDESLSSASLTIASNQLSPISVLETSFSADTSSLDSPDDTSVKLQFEAEDYSKLVSVDSELLDSASSAIEEMRTDILTEMDTVDVSLNPEKVTDLDFKFLESRLDSYCEVLSHVEWLLRSEGSHGSSKSTNSSLHSFLLNTLDAVVDFFSDSEAILGNTDKQGCQVTNFLFDCIIEYLSVKLLPKAGNTFWPKQPHLASASTLADEICQVIRNWKRKSGGSLDAILKNELHCTATKWAVGEAELAGICSEIEDDFVEMLVGEFCS